MPREYSTVIGSGTTPNVAHSPPYGIPDGTYPVPSQRNSLRNRAGDGIVVLNPEDFSVSIGISTQAISVGGTATALPNSALENRRALVIHNDGPGILYIGGSNVTTANGIPLASSEKIAFDIGGTPNVKIYAVSASSSDVRIMELA